MTEDKNEALVVYIAPATKREIERMAKAEERSISFIVRRLLDQAITRMR